MESALTRTGKLMDAASKKCRESPEVVKAAAKLKGLAAAEGSCSIASATDTPQVRLLDWIGHSRRSLRGVLYCVRCSVLCVCICVRGMPPCAS